jgi:hypothetical protein
LIINSELVSVPPVPAKAVATRAEQFAEFLQAIGSLSIKDQISN